jgi:hypothetical protein
VKIKLEKKMLINLTSFLCAEMAGSTKRPIAKREALDGCFSFDVARRSLGSEMPPLCPTLTRRYQYTAVQALA